MHPTRSLAAIPLALLALHASAPAAHAGTFTVTSCTLAQPTAAPWVSARTASWLTTDDQCRPFPGTWISGMILSRFYYNAGRRFDSSGSWQFAVSAPLVIRRVRGTGIFKQ